MILNDAEGPRNARSAREGFVLVSLYSWTCVTIGVILARLIVGAMHKLGFRSDDGTAVAGSVSRHHRGCLSIPNDFHLGVVPWSNCELAGCCQRWNREAYHRIKSSRRIALLQGKIFSTRTKIKLIRCGLVGGVCSPVSGDRCNGTGENVVCSPHRTSIAPNAEGEIVPVWDGHPLVRVCHAGNIAAMQLTKPLGDSYEEMCERWPASVSYCIKYAD